MSDSKPPVIGLLKCWYVFIAASVCLPGIAQVSGRIIEYNTTVKVEDKNLIEEKSFYFEVIDKQSDWMSDIKIPYNNSSRIDIIEAYSMNSDGKIVKKLTRKEISTRSDISQDSFYEDDMVKEFNLRNNEYPYYIRYTYRRTTDRFVFLANWTPLLHSELKTENATLKIDIPLKYKIKILKFGEFSFRKDSADDRLIYSWKAQNLNPVEKEIMAPPEEELYPTVICVPEKFKYGIDGKLDSWQSIGIWHSKINAGLDSLPESEKVKLQELLKGKSDRIDKMKALYHYLQDNTHYVNVSVDIGGLQPYPASYVSYNKYGDCKALTIYMKALLRFAGIESYYTSVNAGKNAARIEKEFPSFQFNHVILCVPDGNDTIWVENTSDNLPFGYIGPFIQNRYALVVNGENSKLVRITAVKQEDFLDKSTCLIRTDPSGGAMVHIEKELKGNEFVKWLAISSDGTDEDKNEAISNEFLVQNNVIRYNLVHPDRESPGLKLIADLSVNNFFRKVGNSKVFNLLPATIDALEKPAQRKYPVRINFPVNQLDSIVIEIPYLNDYVVELPGNILIESRFGKFSASFSMEPGKLKIVRRFILPAIDIPLGEYESFYSFIDSINRSTRKSPVVLNSKL